MSKHYYNFASYVLVLAPSQEGGFDIALLRNFDREHSEEVVAHFSSKKAAVKKLERLAEKIQNRIQGRWSAPWAVRDYWIRDRHPTPWPEPDRFVVLIDDFLVGGEQDVLLSYTR